MNKTINKIINFLKSFEGLSFVTMLALTLMIHHTSSIYVYYTKDQNWFDWLTGICFGIVADLGILVFVTRGLTKTSLYFTFGQFVINMFFYYNIVEIKGIQWIGATLMSAVLPAIIAIYSHQIKLSIFETEQANKKLEDEKKYKSIEDMIENKLSEQDNKLKDIKDNIDNDVNKVKEVLNKNTQTLLNNKNVITNDRLLENYVVTQSDLL